MDIAAVTFDVGETLVYYNNFLNWQKLYSPALKQVMKECDIEYTQKRDKEAQEILLKYNTRVNFREYEVSSNIIFNEIFLKWEVDNIKLKSAKSTFYEYFSKGASCFEDAKYVLQTLKNNGIKIGILTDVAYGMDNEYVFRDLEPIVEYIDIVFTSTDVGYRKPRIEGYEMLQKEFNLQTYQMIYVGNEEKDIVGANNADMISVLINREDIKKDYSQDYTISSLTEILKLIY